MDFNELKNELQNAQYAALSDSAAADALNAINIPTQQAIKTHSIKKYLVLVDKLVPIEESLLPAAKNASRALMLFEEFDIREPAVEAKLDSILADLKTALLVDATDEAIIKAMGSTLISRAHEINLGHVEAWHIEEARK